jgi:hypothetical protein
MTTLAASRLLVGILLLLLGRRLYWLFVAGVGFVTGLELAPRVLPHHSETVIVLVALALAVVGALIAVLATKVVVGLIGFAAGGGIAALLLPSLGIEAGAAQLIVYVVAGVVGALLLLVLFEWALILLSSVAGATLLGVTVEPLLGVPPRLTSVLIVVLAVVGALVQARIVGTAPDRSA